MLIGYARVSKADGTQILDLQRDALTDAGVDEERIYEDRASGRHDHRPGLEPCLKALQPGNTFVVWKLDRLGRNLKHLVTTVEELHDRGVGLRVLAGAGAEIDTTTANGRLVLGIFAALAEFERELIAERTRAGLAAARARGRLGGRPRKMDVAMLRMAMRTMADRETNAHDLAKRFGMTTMTLYMYVNGEGTRPEAARRGPGRMSQDDDIPAEALLDLLRRQLDGLPPRHAARRAHVESTANLFGVSRATLYRGLAGQLQPRGLRRADRGQPRKMARGELERYCEIVAALKLRTSNLKGRRLSTARCIELLERHGVETPQGPVQAPGGLLHRATVNRYVRMTRAPAAARFEARTPNALWQFDISPSDLKEIEQPVWIDPDRKGLPVPMLFSVINDRSGGAYHRSTAVFMARQHCTRQNYTGLSRRRALGDVSTF